MFAPFAFIQPDNLADIIAGATTSSLFVVGDFFTYKATNLGNVAILTNSGSRTFVTNGVSTFNVGDDTVFSNGYIGFTGTVNQQNVVVTQDLTFEPSGKLTLVGRGEYYSGSLYGRRVVRVTPYGNQDPDHRFGTFNQPVTTVKLLRNGQYIFSGPFTSYSGSSVSNIIRTANSGANDSTFKAGTLDNAVWSIQEDSSNRLILGGPITTYSGSSRNYIVRVNTNGTIDNTFNIGSGFNGTTNGIVLQSDGKIIVTGGFTTYSGSSVNRIVRLNTNGTLDTTYKAGQLFNPTFGSQFPAVGLGIQTDDKVIAYGNFTQYSGSTRNRITRINTDGTLDTTFNPGDGFDRIDPVSTHLDGASERKIKIDSAGKIYVADAFTSYSGSAVYGLVKLNTDGTIDTTFDYTGSAVSGIGYNRWDTSTSSNRRGAVSSISITGSSVAIGGYFHTWKEPVAAGIVRLDLSGSSYVGTKLHTFGGFQYQSYNSFGQFLSQVNVIKKIDTRYLVAGNFTQYNSSGSNRIIMLNSDFSRDSTFNIGTGFNASVYQINYIPSTNKILVTGAFTTYSGSTANRIVQLNTNGTIDTGFASGLTGFNNDVSCTSIESNGKIVVGGSFTTYNGATQNRILRLNANGAVDADFKTNNGVSTLSANVYTVAVQTDGKIVFGGNLVNTYSGSLTSTRIFRTDASGAIDPTFKTGTGLNAGLIFAKQTPDGKLMIIAEGTTYSGSTINRIARLDASGAIDTTFKTGTGLNYSGLASNSNPIEFDTSGNMYLTGQFTHYSGSRVNGLVKITQSGSIDTIFSVSGSSGIGFDKRGYGLLLDTSTI